jgi:hypothetical protein
MARQEMAEKLRALGANNRSFQLSEEDRKAVNERKESSYKSAQDFGNFDKIFKYKYVKKYKTRKKAMGKSTARPARETASRKSKLVTFATTHTSLPYCTFFLMNLM